jgi:DNA-binding CsgD family transcriptional regulator/tetratricopeptide (TPR) repeat protein
VHAVEELERGRECYARGAWREAHKSLSDADRASPLHPQDLELLARSGYMLGRDDAYRSGLERAHRAYLDAGESLRAVRCAFWIGHNLLFRGEVVRARGWFARAGRLLDGESRECVERGWLLVPVWLEQMAAGDWTAGHATAAEAASIGDRFGDADLVWLARDEQGRALLKQGRVDEGLRLVDEILVVAAAGELSPVVTGIVFCNTIAFCRDVYELRPAREWTDALTRWCESQPEMVAHNGLCLVHRSEMMQLQGAWDAALEAARQATERFTEGVLNQLAGGAAHYRAGEVCRLRGQLDAAEAAYREASRCGYEPQPGLALVRLAQGKPDAAAAAVRRAVGETTEPLKRAELLPAYVEIMLETGEVEVARSAARQLREIAERRGGEALIAMSAYCCGAVALADGAAEEALAAGRRAAEAWHELGAPYEVARSRVLIGVACRSLGDADTAALELEAARGVFAGLDAVRDVERVDSLAPTSGRAGAHGLTRREVEVLRLVASGKTNRQIASALVISERTVARHVQNIFAKLRVRSRTAASAFAFEHDLI